MRNSFQVLVAGFVVFGIPVFSQGLLYGQTPRYQACSNSLAPYVNIAATDCGSHALELESGSQTKPFTTWEAGTAEF